MQLTTSRTFLDECKKQLYTLPPDEVAEAMEMYNSGDSFKKIGEWLGCAPETVRDSIAVALELGFHAWPKSYIKQWRKLQNENNNPCKPTRDKSK